MPRLTIVDRAAYDLRQAEVAAEMAAGPRGHAGGLMGLWLHNPELAGRMQRVGEYLRFQGTLPGAVTELAILLVARDWRCIHEWVSHVPLAEAKGLSPAMIEAVRQGARPDFAGAPEAELAWRYVTALLRDRRVDAATFAAFRDRFGPAGVIEMAGLIGHYVIGAATLNAAEYTASPDVKDPFPA